MVKPLNRTAIKYLNMKVSDAFNSKPHEGLNGVEIEVEGQRLPYDIPGGLWNAIEDGSLRGESKEYVFRKPLSEEEGVRALEQLNESFKEAKSIINSSYRTSVHVHVNCQSLTFKQVYNYILLYIIFEDILIDLCGRERDGNLFCLRVTDAEQLVEALKFLPTAGDIRSFHGDHLRYASININSIGKYGSLEFRAYRGTTETADISMWVKLLNRLREAAIRYDNPQQIIENFSKLGYRAFTLDVFGDNPIAHFVLAARNAEERLVFGVRYAQEIAYCVKDWNTNRKPNKDEERIYAAMKQRVVDENVQRARVNPFAGAIAGNWEVFRDPFAPQPQEEEEI